jgi:hypothetical protein
VVTGCRWDDYIEPKKAEHKTEVGSMSRRKTKKQKQHIVKYESNNISQEQMIEIQAEAYYRALKRIEDEKSKEDEQKPEIPKKKWHERILFFLNVCLWPWKINKRFNVSNRIYDSIPVMFVSFVLRLTGGIMWLVGMVGLVTAVYNLIVYRVFKDIVGVGPFSLVILLFGAIFILAADAFEKETDSNKIYAYSASIIALVSCIISIIALVGM